MSQKPFQPIRISPWAAALECGVTLNKVKAGLKANEIDPGKDGKFSFKDIVTALSSRSGLEQKAKEARYQRQIDEAEAAKIDRDEKRGKVVNVNRMKDFVADLIVQVVQFIRHSEMNEKQQKLLIEQIRSMKFEPTNKVVPFESL